MATAPSISRACALTVGVLPPHVAPSCAVADHNLHHPLATRMRELVRSGELGALTQLEISSGLPAPDALLPLLLPKIGLPVHRRSHPIPG